MAPGERKSTEPRRRWSPRRLAGAGREGGPAGVLASQVLGFALPRADRTEKVPRRRKAPDFSNSDVQRATIAIHSLGLVCGFFFPVFVIFFFFLSVFVLSAPLEMPPPPLSLSPRGRRQRSPQVRARARHPGGGNPRPGRVLRSPAPGKTPARSVPAEPIPLAARSRAKTHRPRTSRSRARLPSL